jgi:hypothetical protein
LTGLLALAQYYRLQIAAATSHQASVCAGARIRSEVCVPPASARQRHQGSLRRHGLLLAAGALIFSEAIAGAFAGERPRLFTHQSYLEDITNDTALPLSDMKAMLAFVLESLPDRVKVYPTENYYYFHFFSQGVRYSGNLRLDMMDRDQGKLHFAYFEEMQEWKKDALPSYKIFDRGDGVAVEKVDDLIYRVSFRGKQVVFELNDLSKIVPPPHAIAADEKYLGPVLDDSGMRFFLVFNTRLELFHYILDETAKLADQLRASARTDRILIGARTGFAYYDDLRMQRKILIGVFESNARLNNAFDGPFDQLPDNFIVADELRDAILRVEPALAGKIDRVGGSCDGSGRYLIVPYATYRTEEDLYAFHRCATRKSVPRAHYYSCFVVEQAYGGRPVPLPLRSKSSGKRERKAR